MLLVAADQFLICSQSRMLVVLGSYRDAHLSRVYICRMVPHVGINQYYKKITRQFLHHLVTTCLANLTATQARPTMVWFYLITHSNSPYSHMKIDLRNATGNHLTFISILYCGLYPLGRSQNKSVCKALSKELYSVILMGHLWTTFHNVIPDIHSQNAQSKCKCHH